MRDLAISVIVFGALPLVLVRPYVGILLWSWLGYMNPHRLAYGFAYDFPFAFAVAVATLLGLLLSSEPKRIPITGLTLTWLLFLAWMGVTTFHAFYPDAAWIQAEKVFKIQLMSLVTILLMQSRDRLRLLFWVIALSLGYFGAKGGVFTIVNGGDFRVWGPPESFIEGNNEIALALLMTLPLMQHLRTTSDRKWVRWGLLALMVLCAFSIVGSQSRGALVGGFAMAFFFWLKSRHKVVMGAAIVAMIATLIVFMPAHWDARMRTIETYETDESAVSRIETWTMALNLANDKLLGGGFELWEEETFARYNPGMKTVHDAHSIYFKVLAEHGWIGLALFLTIGILAWRTGTWIIRNAEGREDLAWLSNLARMIQVSLAAYATGGAFLGLSYFDLYWQMVALLVIGKLLLQRQLAIAPTAAPPSPEIAAAAPLTPEPRLGRGGRSPA